ncbi:unnamed protein product, partial [Prorocentrum cordatum]
MAPGGAAQRPAGGTAHAAAERAAPAAAEGAASRRSQWRGGGSGVATALREPASRGRREVAGAGAAGGARQFRSRRRCWPRRGLQQRSRGCSEGERDLGHHRRSGGAHPVRGLRPLGGVAAPGRRRRWGRVRLAGGGRGSARGPLRDGHGSGLHARGLPHLCAARAPGAHGGGHGRRPGLGGGPRRAVAAGGRRERAAAGAGGLDAADRGSLLPELASLLREAVAASGPASGDASTVLEEARQRLELPPEIWEAALAARPVLPEPQGLPDEAQVRGMIASALLTADGKVWRVVQKAIDMREAWPRLAEDPRERGCPAGLRHRRPRQYPRHATHGLLLGQPRLPVPGLPLRPPQARALRRHGLRYARLRVQYGDRELPAEIIDAVFKELLVHEGLSFTQCEHVIAKLMQPRTSWSTSSASGPASSRRCRGARGVRSPR